MTKLFCQLAIWRNQRGQDLVEYALMAGFVAVASGAVIPSVGTDVSKIFSRITSVMSSLGGA